MTTIGEIRAMEARLPALLARQSMREADVALVASPAGAERIAGWFDRQIVIADGSQAPQSTGAIVSHQAVRERRKAAWERRQAEAVG